MCRRLMRMAVVAVMLAGVVLGAVTVADARPEPATVAVSAAGQRHPEAVRLGGVSRYETSAAVARWRARSEAGVGAMLRLVPGDRPKLVVGVSRDAAPVLYVPPRGAVPAAVRAAYRGLRRRRRPDRLPGVGGVGRRRGPDRDAQRRTRLPRAAVRSAARDRRRRAAASAAAADRGRRRRPRPVPATPAAGCRVDHRAARRGRPRRRHRRQAGVPAHARRARALLRRIAVRAGGAVAAARRRARRARALDHRR